MLLLKPNKNIHDKKLFKYNWVYESIKDNIYLIVDEAFVREFTASLPIFKLVIISSTSMLYPVRKMIEFIMVMDLMSELIFFYFHQTFFNRIERGLPFY